ncbi:class I SAM-dependent methyltransferase [Lutibacter flavus]|uniref:Methyltransferase domain-containing protein n=1 Tax=Lutibacter flavus TaxID=691689 RepID=A0A238VR43_9FLAO|nr:class I SAM-dependent methyltransferase [Lutibacter flavus]SNR36617.1 Methyltransferase domain-containing protein [Lutibacter flavus]
MRLKKPIRNKYISSGERLEFYDFSNVTIEHLHRYAIANDFVKSKVVLDIASGEGYGSNILSTTAAQVIGVDIDIESIKNANKKYAKNNLKYILGSADNIPLESNSIDIVVSFETIEHHDKHEEMMLEIKRVLKQEGILIMSSPDKKYYTDLSGQINPFHIKELYFEEFKTLVNNYFNKTTFLFQKAYNFNSFVSEQNNFDITIYSGDNTKIEETINQPLYNIVIASDIAEIRIKPSFFNGKNITDLYFQKLFKEKLQIIHETISFRIGKIIVFPFFYIKKIMRKINRDKALNN